MGSFQAKLWAVFRRKKQDFEQFITLAPYLNTIGGKFSFGKSTQRKRISTKLLRFFKILKLSYPDFSNLTNQYLIQRSKVNSISTLKRYFAQLTILCNHFLVLREISIDKYYYNEALLYQYQDRNIDKLFDLKYSDVIKSLNTPASYHMKDFLMKFNVGLIKFMRDAPKFKLKNNNEIFEVINLQVEPSFNLLIYFIFDSISLIVNLIGHANGTNINLKDIEFYSFFKKCFPDNLLEDIIQEAIRLTSNKTTKKIIELYWLKYLFRTIKGKEAGVYFRRYINILGSITPKLGLNEKYGFYHERHFGFWLAMAYHEFEKDEFKLYSLYLANKGYKAAGKEYLELQELKNIIIRGVNTKRFNWSIRIMQKYIVELKVEERKCIQHFFNAQLFFQRDKDFEKSLEELREIERIGQHSMTRDILHLYILIYYELGYYDSALTSIDSLRKYLANQNIGAATAVPFKKFITCVKKLIINKINNKDDFAKVYSIINENNLIASKKWLLEKLSEHRSKKYSKQLA